MDYVLRLLKNEKQKLKNDRQMFKLALTKNSLESRDIIDSEIAELESAMEKLTEREQANDNIPLVSKAEGVPFLGYKVNDEFFREGENYKIKRLAEILVTKNIKYGSEVHFDCAALKNGNGC